jgi:hypothetical protein
MRLGPTQDKLVARTGRRLTGRRPLHGKGYPVLSSRRAADPSARQLTGLGYGWLRPAQQESV